MEHYDPFIGPRANWLPAGNRELIFGLFAVVSGLFFANMVIFGGFRLGFAVASVLSIVLSWWYLHRSGCRGDWYTKAMLALCLVIAAGFGWSADEFVKGWLVLFLLAGVNLSFCQMAGQNRYAPGSARSLFDAASGIFRFGMGRSGEALRGVAAAFRAGSVATQRSGAVLAGLGIAVPALAVVIPLLISSDAAFEGLIGLLPDFDLYAIVTTVFFGALFGVFSYSRAVALRHAEPAPATERDSKKLHALTVSTALGAVCVVYLAYLFSQLAYFVGGFSGILPKGFTAAEYARRGFFEMAWLVAINLALMTFGISTARAPGSTKFFCLFLGLVSEFLVAASVAKMVLYIGVYGLTRLRVLTMVIMAFLGITTALVSVWLFVPKLQYMKAVMLVALAMGAAVLWVDVDTQVARYNVTHYLSGDLENVDVDYLTELGPGAVESLEMLAQRSDPRYSTWATIYLKNWYIAEAEDFRSMTYVNQRARDILKPYHPKIEDAPATDHP